MEIRRSQEVIYFFKSCTFNISECVVSLRRQTYDLCTVGTLRQIRHSFTFNWQLYRYLNLYGCASEPIKLIYTFTFDLNGNLN